MKGSLIRDILYPKELKFKFYSDGLKFVAIMAAVAVIGNMCTLPVQISIGVPVELLIDRALDLITVTVPPALPAAMSCGIVFAINRLKKAEIFCISPPRINMAGQISTFVFDKTGTLTEEGLSVLGFRATERSENKAKYLNFTNDVHDLMPEEEWLRLSDAKRARSTNPALMVEAMAACTAVTYVNGKLVGDPLDVQMFQATGWVLDEAAEKENSPRSSDQIIIAKVYPGKE